MTVDELREQDALPGGRIGPATTNGNGTRTWQAPARAGHREDAALDQTTVRWRESRALGGPGWYVLTNEGPKGACIARTGPYRESKTLQLEAEVIRLTGADQDTQDEAAIAVVAEAVNVRMADAASRLTLQIGAERERQALAGEGCRADHERDPNLSAESLEENAALLDVFDALRDAVETRTLWQQS